MAYGVYARAMVGAESRRHKGLFDGQPLEPGLDIKLAFLEISGILQGWIQFRL